MAMMRPPCGMVASALRGSWSVSASSGAPTPVLERMRSPPSTPLAALLTTWDGRSVAVADEEPVDAAGHPTLALIATARRPRARISAHRVSASSWLV
jgi:hypothetical protein